MAVKMLVETFLNILYPEDTVCLACGSEFYSELRFGLCPRCFQEMPWHERAEAVEPAVLRTETEKWPWTQAGKEPQIQAGKEPQIQVADGGRIGRCQVCSRPDIRDYMARCPTCLLHASALAGGFSVFSYAGLGKALIRRFKYHDCRYLAVPLARMMAAHMTEAENDGFQRPQVLVAVPIHENRRRRRGFNQATLLAEALSRETGIPFAGHVLQRVKDTRPLSALDHSARQQVMTHAVAPMVGAGVHVVGQRVGLVDDIFTTGVTMGACAEPLRQLGAESVWSMTLAVRHK